MISRLLRALALAGDPKIDDLIAAAGARPRWTRPRGSTRLMGRGLRPRGDAQRDRLMAARLTPARDEVTS